jgi:hypothetical protein
MTDKQISPKLGGYVRVASIVGLLCSANLQAVQVDSELVILVDVSGSVNGSEHSAMMESIAQSFESSSVVDSVGNGVYGSIAATLVYWSSSSRQQVGVSWMEISDASSATQFANLVRASVRPFRGSSAIGSALTFAAEAFGSETGGSGNGFESTRQAITLYADGIDNNTPPRGTREENVQAARDAAIADGVDLISAIVVNNPRRDLETYYSSNVVGGQGTETGSVAMVDYGSGSQGDLEQSLSTTISGGTAAVPEPSTFVLVGLTGLFLLKRKRA